MLLPETTPLKIAHLPLAKLVVPDFYEKLFFAGGDQVFNYPQESLVCVRPIDQTSRRYEIVAGVELYKLFHREGKETVPAVIADMTAKEARRYATDHALRTSAQSSQRSVVQLIVAARDNEAHGGVWSVDRVIKHVGIKRSTYTHAWSSINYACLELKKQFPAETEGLGTTELVAMAVCKDFMPPFTSLYLGAWSVNKFYRECYLISDLARERSRQQQEAKAMNKPESTSVGDETSGAKVIPLARPTSTPSSTNQLMVEGFIRFAQALAARRSDVGVAADQAEKEVTQLISDFLGKHQELEGELLHFCNLIVKHLKKQKGPSSAKTEQGKSKKAEEEVAKPPKPLRDLPLMDSIPVAV